MQFCLKQKAEKAKNSRARYKMEGLIILSFYANVSLYRETTAVLFVVLSLPMNTMAVFYWLRSLHL